MPISLHRCLTNAAAVGVLFSSFGCAQGSQATPANSSLNGSALVGEVAVVNRERRFVLVDTGPFLSLPAPGTPLRAISAAGKTADLRASQERQRPFIAADILNGDPAIGDQVWR